MTQVRMATVEDAGAIAEVHVRAWQVAYRGAFPDEFLNGLSDSIQDRVAWREGTLMNPSHRSRTLVVTEADRVLGFVDTSPTRDDDLDPEHTGEVLAIYVSPRHWGQGFGQRLLAGAEVRLSEDGFMNAMLWVLEQNRRARRFYEEAGWAHDGSVKTDQFGGHAIAEVRYLKNLA